MWGEVEKEGGSGGGTKRGEEGREIEKKGKKENNDLRENVKRDTQRKKTKWEGTSEECDLSLLSFGEVTVGNKLEMTFLLLCVVDDLHVS